MKGKNYSAIEEKLKKSRQILWERYLSDLATGIIPTNEVVKKADYFGVDIISKYYCSLIILLDSMPIGLDQTAYTEYLKAEAIINEKLKGNRDIIKYNVNIKKAILIFKHDDKEELEMNCNVFAKSIKQEIEKNTSCNSIITMGGIRETVQGIAESIRDAETTMKLNNIFGKNTIVTIKGRYGHIIHKAKTFIYENYFKSDISLNSVAEYVNLSPNHLSMVFSQETGLTFIEYLTKLRIAKAKIMLKSTNMRTSEIAFKVGYNDPHYFSNVFKKAVGCAPTNFRENIQTVLSTD
jgi:two-component system response regulator YesN